MALSAQRATMKRKTNGTVATTTIGRLARFIYFQLASTLGVGIGTAFCSFAIFEVYQIFDRHADVHAVRRLLTETPGFPLQVIFAMVAGYLLRRRYKDRSIFAVWILPTVLLASGVLQWHGYSAMENSWLMRWQYFFGSGCQPRNHCFDQFLFTLPFISSVAFTMGALAERFAIRRFGAEPMARHDLADPR